MSNHAVLEVYERSRLRRAAVLIMLAAACAAAFLMDVATGPSALSLGDILSALTTPDKLTPAQSAIVWQVRLPLALMALLVGAALALAGAEMQTILDNPLASPFTLGVSSAASFGASLAIVLGLGLPLIPTDWLVSLNAFVFAFGSVLLLQAVGRLRAAGLQTLILFGIALVFAFNALTALVQYLSSQEALQQLVFWTMGSLTRATWSHVGTLALVVAVVTPLSLLSSRAMTALRLGDDRAMSFGVDVRRLRFASLLRVSVLAATAVAFVGSVGFIGLVGPHISRLLLGEDHRYHLPGSLLSGALIMSLASTLSKVLAPGAVMPIGIVTAMIGVPAFLVLIFRRSTQA